MLPMEDKKISLNVVRDEVSNCTKCQILVDNRTQTVFGVGNINSKLMIIGEAGGKEEDRQGIPFVGEAGILLNNIIQACGWNRNDLYITNTIKCRPPNNRIPAKQEVEFCRGYLDSEIKIINPQYLLLLGSTATNAILGTSVTSVRGQIHDWNGKKVFSTYHPAYLLRKPEDKHLVWADLQPLIEIMKN
jgi:DNA polymerase